MSWLLSWPKASLSESRNESPGALEPLPSTAPAPLSVLAPEIGGRDAEMPDAPEIPLMPEMPRYRKSPLIGSIVAYALPRSRASRACCLAAWATVALTW